MDVLSEIQPGIAIASTGKHKGYDLDPKTRKTINDHSGAIRIVETARSNKGKLSARDVVLDTDGKPIDGNGILYRTRRLARQFK